MREKVGKSPIHCVFPMLCGSGGSKSRLAKAAGAEPAGQRRDEKLHAVVARSTFPSQNVQSTPRSGHFWKLRCWKSARRCGAKHISKSKCTKHLSLGPLLEVEMSQKFTPLWREAHWHESVSSALNFPFLKEVSENSSFLMSCTSKNEEVSQNCFVSDVVKFKKWRRLAELFRFRRSYVQTLWKSRGISSFLILQIDR